MPEETENLDVSQTSEGSEASEGVITPPEEETSTQPQSEEKTVPYSRFKEVNDKYRELKMKTEVEPEKKAVSQPEREEAWEAPADPIALVRFTKEVSDYSADELELATKLAPTRNLDGILKATKDLWFKTAVQAMREKVAKEKQILSPSSPSATINQDIVKDVLEAEKNKDSKKFNELIEKRVAELETGRNEGI